MVLSYLLRSPSRPDLAIATSPWLQMRNPPKKWLSLFIELGNRIAPFLTFSTGLRSSDFSTGDSDAEKREKDEFVHNRISARLFSEVEQESIWIQSHFNEIKTPLLMMQGRDDKIMRSAATRQLKEGAPGQVNYHEWKNAGHQLHNSESSGEVMEYLIDWIKEGIR
jgi:acylglycerol lipase